MPTPCARGADRSVDGADETGGGAGEVVDVPGIEGNGAIVYNDEPRCKVQNGYLYRSRYPVG